MTTHSQSDSNGLPGNQTSGAQGTSADGLCIPFTCLFLHQVPICCIASLLQNVMGYAGQIRE